MSRYATALGFGSSLKLASAGTVRACPSQNITAAVDVAHTPTHYPSTSSLDFPPTEGFPSVNPHLHEDPTIAADWHP